MNAPREWFEYDCPVQGIDFDIEPLPDYGSRIRCSACDGEHVANEEIGRAWRMTDEDIHPDIAEDLAIEGYCKDITDEWKARTM